MRPRIFLADDHPAVLKATTALLKPQFDVVGTVPDGAALVSEALRLCPDVIVADITMPGLSGIDAAHRLRECGSSAKFVFLTIHSEEHRVIFGHLLAVHQTALDVALRRQIDDR